MPVNIFSFEVHEFVFVTSRSLAASLCFGPASGSEPRQHVPWLHFARSQAYKLVGAFLVLPLHYPCPSSSLFSVTFHFYILAIY